MMMEMREDGRSLREIAGTLNEDGVRPKRGRRWHPATVSRVVERATAS